MGNSKYPTVTLSITAIRNRILRKRALNGFFKKLFRILQYADILFINIKNDDDVI